MIRPANFRRGTTADEPDGLAARRLCGVKETFAAPGSGVAGMAACDNDGRRFRPETQAGSLVDKI